MLLSSNIHASFGGLDHGESVWQKRVSQQSQATIKRHRYISLGCYHGESVRPNTISPQLYATTTRHNLIIWCFSHGESVKQNMVSLRLHATTIKHNLIIRCSFHWDTSISWTCDCTCEVDDLQLPAASRTLMQVHASRFPNNNGTYQTFMWHLA